MGRSPCCETAHMTKGAWTREEDERLVAYIRAHGEGCWRSLPRAAGLLRCGKSCRLRWTNYLRPDLKRGNFTADEDGLIVTLHGVLGNRWSLIAARLPGRTDNEIKNYWNTHLRKRLLGAGIDPVTHRPVAAAEHNENRTVVAFQPPKTTTMVEPPPRCPDLNLDLCISPPSTFQEQEEDLVKPTVKRELLHGGGLCFECSLGLNTKGAAEGNCSSSNKHFLGLGIGVLDIRSLEMK